MLQMEILRNFKKRLDVRKGDKRQLKSKYLDVSKVDALIGWLGFMAYQPL